MILDAGRMADAQILFKNTCAACHREDGGGSVGPNLTDDYWLHGGSLKDVFKSVKYGWKDKGMPEWQHNMSAKQIAALTSYIKGMKGKKVLEGKAPQGDLFVESGGQPGDSLQAGTGPTQADLSQTSRKDDPIADSKNDRAEKGAKRKQG